MTRYVRPPLVPREAPAAWRAVWPFRLLAAVVLVGLVLLVVVLYAHLNDAADQAPEVGAAALLRR